MTGMADERGSVTTEHRAGPVRSEAAREAILAATTRLFQDRGYDHLTIEGIAKEAGVGKQTIYRWWPSRGALIADCLIDGRLLPIEFEMPDTGDVLLDVETWLGKVQSILDDPKGAALLRSVVGAAADDAGVGDQLDASLGVERSLADRLAAGVRAGQLPESAPVGPLADAILGAVVVRSLGRKTSAAEPLQQLARFLLGGRG